MISEQELRRVAGRVGLGVGQAEHEYPIKFDEIHEEIPSWCERDACN